MEIVLQVFGGLIETLRPLVVHIIQQEAAKNAALGISATGPKTLPAKAAANHIGVGLTTFKELVADGEIKATNIRGMKRYAVAELDRYLRKCVKEGA